MFTSMRSRRIPALLTRMSTRPKRSTACSTMRPAPAKSATFSPFATASPPSASISRTTSCAGPSSAPSPASDAPRSLTTIFAPARASASACSRPIPRPAPVTIATLPLKSGIALCEITTVDFTLTDEQELIRSSAREFAARELAPHTRDWDRAEEIDRALVPKLADAGFLGAGWDEEFGGSGLDTLSYALVVEELGKVDSSVRGIVSVNVGLVGKTIARFGTPEQTQQWLPRLASGEGLGCYALTEPGCGSDAAALATRAERDGDDWLLTGSKTFITLGTWASVALVFARTGDEGARGITCFLVPTGAAGFSSHPIKGKLGLRAQDTAELTLDGV